MNIDEAIKHIENIMPYVGRNVKDSLDMAIRALEKQKELTDRLSRIKSIIKAYDEGCSSEFAAINSIRRVVSE
jgi:hypothetical protein